MFLATIARRYFSGSGATQGLRAALRKASAIPSSMPVREGLVIATDVAEVAADVLRFHEATAAVAYAHIFTNPFPHEEAAERWSTYPGTILLAVAEGVTVGFAACQADLLDALYVLPDAAGKGIGSRLLAALPEVRSLWVLQDNERGRRFYEKRGWKATGDVRPAYGTVMEVLYKRRP
jgi:GNAT superfamily N-acetyltransferase